ncbi:Bug family tripartite tricarboxylate transporter substrate binding protein [Xylophilus sp.]|uniref:Bug family tripartite tricarboxylate transporter substrate binding protein n=1 Tax=Xylophilus sp. TaxID=2653893 RepID=UPI0013B75E2D|nr:tripartite tricarboxylate transporter substrate binding protein [Xylophilus sp.]KAF1044950.1 MAG: hypothetical protein GAK38_03301 [Xylophilus sp.]
MQARRLFLGAVASAAACLAATVHAGDGWPQRPIHILLPVAAGGTSDASTRLVQSALEKRLGQPVVIENRPGGTGTVVANLVASASPDGYTLGMVNMPFAATATSLKPFTPVAFFLQSQTVWSVRRSDGIKNLADLVRVAKAEPGAVSYAFGGRAQASQFSVAAFERDNGIKLTPVPYRGAAPALTDVVGGQVRMLFSTPTTAAVYAKRGDLRPIAVASSRRSRLMPDVPTVAEQGFAPIDIGEWSAFIGPAGMPEAAVQTFNAALAEVVADPQMRRKLEGLDLEPRPMKPAEVGAFLEGQMKFLQQLISSTGMQLQ